MYLHPIPLIPLPIPLAHCFTTNRGRWTSSSPRDKIASSALGPLACWRFRSGALSIPMEQDTEEHIYIREAASQLNRRMGTLRKWEQQKILPEHLRSQRGVRGWRYWTPDQIEGIKDWIRETNRHSGNALPHYNPTEEKLDKAIEAMRRPHSSSRY